MSENHLSEGSTCPPLATGTLRLYSMRYCPYAQRARLVLAHQGIPYETVNVNLKTKPDWWLKKNPAGAVPVLEQDDKIVCESTICEEYLDDLAKEKKLHPADPYLRARHRMLMEGFSRVITPFFSIYRAATDEDKAKAIENLQAALQIYEDELKHEYFGGDSGPALVDFHIYPWFERMPLVSDLSGRVALPRDRLPKLCAWVDRMQQRPDVKATMRTPQEHIKFAKSYLGGNPEYDFVL